MSPCSRCKSLNSECHLGRGSDHCVSCLKVDHSDCDVFVREQTYVFLFVSSWIISAYILLGDRLDNERNALLRQLKENRRRVRAASLRFAQLARELSEKARE